MSEGEFFEIAIDARNDDFDPGDDRWRDQVGGLLTELRQHVDVERRDNAVEGAKGGLAGRADSTSDRSGMRVQRGYCLQYS